MLSRPSPSLSSLSSPQCAHTHILCRIPCLVVGFFHIHHRTPLLTAALLCDRASPRLCWDRKCLPPIDRRQWFVGSFTPPCMRNAARQPNASRVDELAEVAVTFALNLGPRGQLSIKLCCGRVVDSPVAHFGLKRGWGCSNGNLLRSCPNSLSTGFGFQILGPALTRTGKDNAFYGMFGN
nr:uncharacterized protein LOC112277484 [Physcomitrium patens]|eukprot:XP_024365646.1 uncharacterized protein LOC112277484 [Physcomitrella patens]